MTTPELIYQSIIFFFSNLWAYIGLIILIITIRGDITKAITATKEFFKKVSANYQKKRLHIKEFEDMKKRVKEL